MNNLVKTKTAVINSDKQEYENYIKERNRLNAGKIEQESMKEKIRKLEDEVRVIKLTLKDVLEKISSL